MRELQVPVGLSFIDDHGQNVSHSVVHPLNAYVALGVIGARGKLEFSQKLVGNW